jgi:hypothetical protein
MRCKLLKFIAIPTVYNKSSLTNEENFLTLRGVENSGKFSYLIQQSLFRLFTSDWGKYVFKNKNSFIYYFKFVVNDCFSEKRNVNFKNKNNAKLEILYKKKGKVFL